MEATGAALVVLSQYLLQFLKVGSYDALFTLIAPDAAAGTTVGGPRLGPGGRPGVAVRGAGAAAAAAAGRRPWIDQGP